MKTLALVLSVASLSTCAPVWASAAVATESAHVPTRMQLCQHELRDLPSEQRRAAVSACLQRRAAAERTIERGCRRQVQDIRGESARQTAQLRRVAMRDCMAEGLARPYAELPSGRKTVTRNQATPPAKSAPAKPALIAPLNPA